MGRMKLRDLIAFQTRAGVPRFSRQRSDRKVQGPEIKIPETELPKATPVKDSRAFAGLRSFAACSREERLQVVLGPYRNRSGGAEEYHGTQTLEAPCSRFCFSSSSESDPSPRRPRILR